MNTFSNEKFPSVGSCGKGLHSREISCTSTTQEIAIPSLPDSIIAENLTLWSWEMKSRGISLEGRTATEAVY